MMDSDQIRFIREEIRKQLNIILNAEAGPNDSQTETINKLFPGGPSITGRPVVHPYGFASRAAQGIISVVTKVGADMQNRMTIGHRDKNRPSDLQEGETVVYSVGDYRLKIQNDKIFVGKGTDYEPVVVGETLRQFLITLVQLIVAHTHLGNLGIETSPPLNAEDFTDAEAQNLDNKKILAQDGGRY